MNTITMWIGDVRDVMADLPDGHADLLVTSPPFLALRSYLPADHPDKHREIGSEPTPAAFLDTLYGLSADWRRLVPEWGSICVELGDTMAVSGGAGGDYNADGLRDGQAKFDGSSARAAASPCPPDCMREATAQLLGPLGPSVTTCQHGIRRQKGDLRTLHPDADGRHSNSDPHRREQRCNRNDNGGPGWPLAKSMCLIPHLYTIGLAYGHNPLTGTPSPAGRWRVRNVVVWARPNPPVGSLGKRNVERRTGDQKFRPATSYITIACTGTGRYFDLDAVRTQGDRHMRDVAVGATRHGAHGHDPSRNHNHGRDEYTNGGNPAGAPPLDWHTDDLDGDWLWKLATAPYSGSHYAVYPLTLPRRMVLAMCPSRVCQVCGWPSERIVALEQHGEWRRELCDGNVNHGGPGAHGDRTRQATTLGWSECAHVHCAWCAENRDDGAPTCGHCGGWQTAPTTDHWRPGRVLDPFGGSGTTAVAAALEGRDAVLIDIDARNIELVHRRLTETVRIVNRVDHPDRVEWTVTPAATSELAAIANGQPSLFDPPKEIA